MTGVVYCQEAKDLLDALAESIHELMKIHEHQFQAVIRGDLDSARFNDLIHMANERKNQAKYAYLQHLENHRCFMISSAKA